MQPGRVQYMVYQLTDDRVVSALRILREMVTEMLHEQVALAHSIKDYDIL